MKTIKNIVLSAGLASAIALVFAGCPGDRYHRSTGAYVDDKSTTAKVKADLITDQLVRGSQVKVQTYQGRVQLSGFVDTAQQKQRAGEIARRVNGVQWVKNDLLVKTQIPQAPGASTAGTTYQGSTVKEPAGSSNADRNNVYVTPGTSRP